ncbi:MAG TPA: iron-containing alcohol dehydrogenase, partial [Gammaproteobacteria bacterium]|nr:iron-containing alcohol dehydrogenase [Gammaproteobacteria bacterium]
MQAQALTMQLPATPASSYPIHIAAGLLAKPQHWLPPAWQDKTVVIITDDVVKQQYGDTLALTLNQLGYHVHLFDFVAGESAKTNQTKIALETQMLQHHCARDTVILALGGGVVGDLAGFIAATFMRGIPII